MVDARCDAVGSEERPFLGSFQKGGGARNRAERRAEPRSIKGGHARGASSLPSSSLPGSRAHLGAPFLSRVHALLSAPLRSSRLVCSLLSSRFMRSPWLALPSSSLVPALVARRGLLVETQTGGAAVRLVVDLRVRTRGAGEGSPAAWEVGTRRDHANGRGRGTRRPLREVPSFLFFLYGCCGAVS